MITAFKVVDYTLKFMLISTSAVNRFFIDCQLIITCAVEDFVDSFLWEIFKRFIKRKIVLFRLSLHIHCGNCTAFHCPSAALDTAVTDTL